MKFTNHRTPSDEVKERINAHMADLFHVTTDGKAFPRVCLICDRFTATKYNWCNARKLKACAKFFKFNEQIHGSIPQSLRDCYKYEGKGKQPWMQHCMLSKRGNYDTRKRAFVCCMECASYLESTPAELPPKSISNGWFFGAAPHELKSLTDIELLLISPVRGYGYVYSGFGGKNRQIKGTLGFFKVEAEGIGRIAVISSALAEILDKDIIYVMHGQMTSEQKNVINQKFQIRPAKVLQAIKWLIANNVNWRDVDLTDFESTLQSRLPRLYDLSTPLDDDDDSDDEERDLELETSESFNVFFPDGTMNRLSFGKESGQEFVRLVNTAREQGMKPEVVADLSKEFTHDMVNDIFGKSCLLQMPYGRGGVNEDRFKSNGDRFKVSLSEFIEHCSYISLPDFHESIFVLKMYNIKIRDTILAKTSQSVRCSTSMQNLRENIDMVDFKMAAQRIASGEVHMAGNTTTRHFLNSIKTCSKAIPHTDDAAKNPRAFVDSMGHAFGQAGIFLTVTPDDENSFLVTCYTGHDDNSKPVDIASNVFDSFRKDAREREKIRLRFPGITALNFGYVLDLVIEEVVGWDVDAHKPTGKPGLFGVPLGYALAVEEQARSTLHAHIILYVRGYETFLENVCPFNSTPRARLEAERVICSTANSAISTKIVDFGNGQNASRKRKAAQAFRHDTCDNCDDSICEPVVVSNQELRNLRHQQYHKVSTAMMTCPTCERKFSSEEIVQMFLCQHKNIPVTRLPDDTGLIRQMTYCYTKPGCRSDDVDPSVCAIKADLHSSKHAKSCFKGTEKRYGGLYKNECRMRKPELPNPRTKLDPVILQGDGSVPFFTWTGEEKRRVYYSVVPRRSEYDLFANNHVPAISHSMIGGNTNASFLAPGPTGRYMVKYPMKGEQKDIAQPYEPIQTCLEKALDQERRHPTDFAESMRLLTMSAFVHNRTNVVSPSQSAFLTRRGTRFLFSHLFAFVPLLDLQRFVMEGTINYARVRQYKGKAYSDVSALHYICRPMELEEVSAKEFYEIYEAKDPTMKNNGNDELDFQDQPDFSHPSTRVDSKTGNTAHIQKCRERTRRHIAWMYVKPFHDTAEFQGDNIMTCSVVTQKMEDQALLILLLCYPFRKKDDLQDKGSFVQKLRDIYQRGLLKNYTTFLQNIQNERGNFLRVRPTCDSLQLDTEKYEPEEYMCSDDDDDGEDEPEIMQGDELESVWMGLEELVDGSSEDTSSLAGKFNEDFVMSNMDFTSMIDKGQRNCGHTGICDITVDVSHDGVFSFVNGMIVAGNHDTEIDRLPGPPNVPSKTVLINVFLNPPSFDGNSHDLSIQEEPIKMVRATGTASSIYLWAKQSKLDEDQTRAFQIFCSAFVLDFVRQVEDEAVVNATHRVCFKNEKLKLLKLAGLIPVDSTAAAFDRMSASSNVVAFLHGHGGSGKSAVIELLVEYCKEFCEEVGEIWTDRTIVVSAFTGVAATLINGKTAHMAFHLNKKSENIPPTEYDAWKHTKLVIIDEISFATRDQIKKVHERLCQLTDRRSKSYGGVNVVFCGDLRQLEPIDNSKDGEISSRIYAMDFPEWNRLINTYIELNGMHRFRKDMTFGKLLVRWRNAELTTEDVETLNSRVFADNSPLPVDLRYATYRNKDKAAINCAIFKKAYNQDSVNANNVCDNCILVFCSDLERNTGLRTFKKLDNQWEQYIWQTFSEGDCSPVEHAGRFDPVLCLYFNRPVMITKNADVEGGVANGTRGLFKKIVLKSGVQPGLVRMSNGRLIRGVRVNQTENIVIAMEANPNKHFELHPEEKRGFMIELDLPSGLMSSNHKKNKTKARLQGTQFPLTCNNATTGHKLQGATVDNIFVHCNTKVANWNYVVASRVRTMAGLYARQKLTSDDLDHLNNFPEKLQRMINQFRREKLKEPLSSVDYGYIFDNQEWSTMNDVIDHN